MNTPKQCVSWLESFPPDIWACFVQYLPGEQLALLIMTGATCLQQRLKAAHVVTSVKLGKEDIRFEEWPRSLNEFPSVKELSTHIVNVVWSDEMGRMRISIPSGLRKLELSGNLEPVAPTFLDFGLIIYTSNLNILLRCDRLTQLEFLDIKKLECRTSNWTACCPQTLTSLSMRFWGGGRLPSSLIHFEAEIVCLEEKSFVPKIPPSLESFVTTSLQGVELLIPVLPPSCLRLSGDISCNSQEGTSFLELLPKNLTCLDLPFANAIEQYPRLASLLPRTLTELTVGYFDSSVWPLLPPELTKLALKAPDNVCSEVSQIVDHYGQCHEVRTIPFGLLPRSITDLELFTLKSNFCGPPMDPNCSYFPPQLKRFTIRNTQLSEETVKLLPSSLTYLNMDNFSERVCRHLPEGLRTLISRSTLMRPYLALVLPKSLTFIELKLTDHSCEWFDYDTGERSYELRELPGYILQQHCQSEMFNWEGFSLPPRLSHVGIAQAFSLPDSFLMHQHLPNLSELILTDCSGFSDLMIPALPRYLIKLDLGKAGKISGKSFEFLPRSLTPKPKRLSVNLRS